MSKSVSHVEEATAVMDRRVKRLKNWIAKDFDGNVAAFVSHFGMSRSVASYISQVFSSNRSFGEKAARNMEKNCKRPTGWLDWDDEKAQKIDVLIEPEIIRYNRARVINLPQRERDKIEEFIEFTCASYESKNK